MAVEKKVSNPLALAVMALLFERPMHPYEMVRVLRERRKHESIKLAYGSLYSVVRALAREGLILAERRTRDGRRPERTVYSLTDAGRSELFGRLRELVGEPAKEYTRFAAGLSFVALLAPPEAAALLGARARLLEREIGEGRSRMGALLEGGLPRLLLVEEEHGLVLREAELGWVRNLAREISDETLDGLEQWKAFHSAREAARPGPAAGARDGAAP